MKYSGENRKNKDYEFFYNSIILIRSLVQSEENIGDGEKTIKWENHSSLYRPLLTLLVIVYES